MSSVNSVADTKICKEVKNLSVLKIEANVDLDCKQTESIDSFVGQVLGLSPILIENSVLKITNDHLKKSVNTGNGVIMGLTKRFSMSFQEQSVLAHELGHVIFDAYFYQNFGPTKKERELDLQIIEKLDPIYALQDDAGECSSKQCMIALQEISTELIPLEKERDQLSKQNEKLLGFLEEFVKPYNELVSDAVAVLHFEDPEIMNRTLSLIHPERGSAKVECRSFLIETHSVYADSDHCALSGLRALIFEKILIPGIKSGEKTQALEKLLKLVTKDITDHYKYYTSQQHLEILDGEHSLFKNRSYITELNSLYELLRGSYSEKIISQLSHEERSIEGVYSESKLIKQKGSSVKLE